MEEQKISRYPGIRAFEINERNLFFGRAMETRKLFAMVKAKPLVVLFAKSGIGKSSLINASLIPKLDHELYQSIRIRIQDTSQDPISTVKAELSNYLNTSKLSAFSGKDPAGASLWEYLRACEFSEGENFRIPVLIFDQFEEFFLHSLGVREEMTRELSNMVSERMPKDVQQKLRKVPFKDRSKELLDWCSPIPVKIIMAIRSDRLSLMDELSDSIPSILHNRFHLQPLLAKQAESAILEPARLSGHHFLSPKFEYDKTALQQILSSLVNQNEEVESFQLQLVCQHIENEILEKHRSGQSAVVTPELYGGPLGIDNILHDYYENAIGRLTKEEEVKARKFIEEGLIVDGRRVGVNAGVEQKSFGIDEALLTKLLHSRMIRAQDTHLGRSYEISHDTLVDPILRSYEVRRKREEEEENEKQLAVQKELLAKERKKLYRALRWAAFSFLLFIMAAIAAYMAYGYYLEAEKQNQISHASQLSATAILQSETYGNITSAIDSAKYALSLDDGIQAKRALLNAAYKNVGHDRNLFYELAMPVQEAEILDVAISKDTQTIAIAYRNGKLRIQNLALDTLSPIIFAHQADINKVLFSPDGNYVLAASKDHTASIRTASDGKRIGEIKHDLMVTDIDFTPDSRFFLTTSLDKSIRIWTLNGELYQSLLGHEMGVIGARFFNDGKNVLSWGVDGFAILWNEHGIIEELLKHDQSVLDGAVSPNEKWIVTGDGNHDVHLWNIKGQEQKTFYGHSAEIRGVRFSPNSRTILTWDGNVEIILWTLGGEKRAMIADAHEANISEVNFSRDGNMILTTSYDNTAKIWDLDGKLIAKCFGHQLGVNGGFFLPGTKKVMTYSADNSIRIWEIEKSIIKKLGSTNGSVIASDCQLKKKEIAVAEFDNTIGIYAYSGDLIKRFSVDLEDDRISYLRYHPDGKRLLVGTNAGALIFLDENGKETKSISHPSSVSWIDKSADGSTIGVVLSFNDSLRLYNPEGEKLLNIATGKIQKMVFTPIVRRENNRRSINPFEDEELPNDSLLLTIGEGKKLYLWNYLTGEKLDTLLINDAQVLDACFSPDGRKIIGGCSDKVTRIWNLEGEILEEFKQQNAAIFSVDVSPDNQYIVSVSGDGTFLIRDFSGSVVVRGSGVSKIRPFAEFTADGKFLLTSSISGKRFLWPFAPKEVLRAAHKNK